MSAGATVTALYDSNGRDVWLYCPCTGTDMPHVVTVTTRTVPDMTGTDFVGVRVACESCGAVKSS